MSQNKELRVYIGTEKDFNSPKELHEYVSRIRDSVATHFNEKDIYEVLHKLFGYDKQETVSFTTNGTKYKRYNVTIYDDTFIGSANWKQMDQKLTKDGTPRIILRNELQLASIIY